MFALLLIGLTAALFADEPPEASIEGTDPGPFYGFWEFKEPAGDTCIVIIKRGGRLSCFWSGTRSQQIEKGTWERTESNLVARWEAGHVDVYEKLGDNAIIRKSYQPGTSLLEEPSLEVRGVRVDSRIPGSLTVRKEGGGPESDLTERARKAEPEREPALDEPDPVSMRNPFTGFWKVDQSTGIFGIGGGEPHFYLRVARGGEASVALRDWEGDQAVRGEWRIDGERLVIRWPNNRRDVLFAKPDGEHILASYKPKDDLDDKPRRRAAAERVNAAEAERYFDAGNFNRLTVTDIRGTWSPAEPTGNREYIDIEGWGKAYRHPSANGGGGTDPGTWRLVNDQVIITWIDGSKDVLRLAFPDMVQDSFPKGEPLTGTPTRTIKVTRTQ